MPAASIINRGEGRIEENSSAKSSIQENGGKSQLFLYAFMLYRKSRVLHVGFK
jgi:hypothetical protein